MLYYAVATVVALLFFGLFVYANPEPVLVYATRNGYYETLPVWILVLIGMILGILLEFLYTRRLWNDQRQQLDTTQARFEKTRARAAKMEASLKDREDEIGLLRVQLGQGEGKAPSEGEATQAEAPEEEAPI